MQCVRSHCDYCVSMGKCCTRCISSPENSIEAKISCKAAWLPLSLSLFVHSRSWPRSASRNAMCFDKIYSLMAIADLVGLGHGTKTCVTRFSERASRTSVFIVHPSALPLSFPSFLPCISQQFQKGEDYIKSFPDIMCAWIGGES